MSKDWTGNGNSVWKTLGASNHTCKEREANDFYATSDRALELFAPRFPIRRCVWECACGNGILSKWLENRGHLVLSTDLVDRGFGKAGVDFLKTYIDEDGCIVLGDTGAATKMSDNEPFDILTNPPYSKAKEFILHALDMIPEDGRVIMFLKTTFLEGKERKRLIYDVNPPRWVFQFSERVLCAKNGDFDGMRRGGGSAVSYAFMVWEKHNDDKITQIRWI